MIAAYWLHFYRGPANLICNFFFAENSGDSKDVDDSTPSTLSNSVRPLVALICFHLCCLVCSVKYRMAKALCI